MDSVINQKLIFCKVQCQNMYSLLSELLQHSDNWMQACFSLRMYNVQQPPPPAPTITMEKQAPGSLTLSVY